MSETFIIQIKNIIVTGGKVLIFQHLNSKWALEWNVPVTYASNGKELKDSIAQSIMKEFPSIQSHFNSEVVYCTKVKGESGSHEVVTLFYKLNLDIDFEEMKNSNHEARFMGLNEIERIPTFSSGGNGFIDKELKKAIRIVLS